jgi:hypothetical protein
LYIQAKRIGLKYGVNAALDYVDRTEPRLLEHVKCCFAGEALDVQGALGMLPAKMSTEFIVDAVSGKTVARTVVTKRDFPQRGAN